MKRATPRIGLRLLSADDLAGDPRPEACIEVSFGPVRPRGEPDVVVLPEPLRMTPADLVRLRFEAELAMGAIRAEVMKAELAWERALGAWYAEGRTAVKAQEPDVALLVRVLKGLRKQDVVPV